MGSAGLLVETWPEASACSERDGSVALEVEQGDVAEHLQATQRCPGVRRILAALPSAH